LVNRRCRPLFAASADRSIVPRTVSRAGRALALSTAAGSGGLAAETTHVHTTTANDGATRKYLRIESILAERALVSSDQDVGSRRTRYAPSAGKRAARHAADRIPGTDRAVLHSARPGRAF